MDNFSQIQRMAAQIAKEHAQMEKRLAPSLELARVIKLFEPSQFRIAKDLAAAMQKHEALFAEIAHVPKVMEDINRRIAASHAFMDSILAPYARVHESLTKQASIFEIFTKRFATVDKLTLTIEQISRSAFAWESTASSLTHKMREIGLFRQRETLANRLFAANGVYSDSVQEVQHYSECLGNALGR